MKTRIFGLFVLIVSFGSLLFSQCENPPNKTRDYFFDKDGISRKVLENYLSRAITEGGFLLPNHETHFQENLRMLKNIEAKFIGRAAFEWTPLLDNEQHFSTVSYYAQLAHKADPDFLLQSCIFEAIFKTGNEVSPEFGVDLIPIPEWVFKEYGLPVEERNFSYEAMLYDDGTYHDHWADGGSVPDITKIETQMYFYYRAVRYINVGIEGIHLGQLEIMNFNDPDNEVVFDLVNRIREYAKDHARRGYVLFDAHVPHHGFLDSKGNLLLDFHSFPQRPKELCGNTPPPYPAKLEIGFHDAIYTKSKGGITPSGWECESLPYLVEIDNSGASNPGVCGGEEWWWPWGWDEINWFAHNPQEYRNHWLHYVVNWLEENDPNGHLQMPGLITIQSDPIVNENGDTIWWYRANTPSETFPHAFGQEETIKEIWNPSD